jgi:hypothetical protein
MPSQLYDNISGCMEGCGVLSAQPKNATKTEIESYCLTELRRIDQQLGSVDIDAGYRLAIKNRIAELEKLEETKHESKIRAWQLVVGIIAALVIAGLTKLLFGA